MCLFLVSRPFTWYRNFLPCNLYLVTLTLKFDLGCYLMIVSARRALLSSDNFLMYHDTYHKLFVSQYIVSHYIVAPLSVFWMFSREDVEVVASIVFSLNNVIMWKHVPKSTCKVVHTIILLRPVYTIKVFLYKKTWSKFLTQTLIV